MQDHQFCISSLERCHALNDHAAFMHHLHVTWHKHKVVRTKAALVSALDLPLYKISHVKEKEIEGSQHSAATSILDASFSQVKPHVLYFLLVKTLTFHSLLFFFLSPGSS